MSPADQTKPLIPYLRQSRAREKTISIEEQWRDIRAWAKRADVRLSEGVIEQNVSGSKHWKDRELGAAVEACHRGEASGIIVAYQSRLSRESGLGTAEVWEEFERAGLRLVCVYENIDTAREDDQEFNFGIQALIARQEWKKHARNWRKGKHAAWERGAYVGPLPAGYSRTEDSGLVPDSKTTEAVRRAFELRASIPRAGWAEVAQVFAEAGVLTRYGSAQWSTSSLRGLIANDVYTGKHPCTCGCSSEVIREEWAIVPGWLWRKAQAARAAEDSHARVRGEGHPLGQGLVRCGTCGAGMCRTRSRWGVQLRCPTRGTGHVSILYAPALEWIMLEAVRYIGPRKKDDGSDVAIAEAEARLADARGALAEYAAQGGLEPGEVPAKSPLRLAVVEAEDALAALDRPDGTFSLANILTPLGVKQHIESLPVPEQRRALRSVIEKVVLSKPSEGHSSRHTLLASQRGEARDRLTVYFEDGSVSPAEGWPVGPVPEMEPWEVEAALAVAQNPPVPSQAEMVASDDPFWQAVAAANEEAGVAT